MDRQDRERGCGVQGKGGEKDYFVLRLKTPTVYAGKFCTYIRAYTRKRWNEIIDRLDLESVMSYACGCSIERAG
jgi:hypothetical protein